MKLTTAFPGGNLRAVYGLGDRIAVAPELRSTQTDWFYWAFGVEGAAGRTLTFDFSPKKWLGPFGPAVSRDLRHWEWLCSGTPASFTYTFPDDAPVYFAHDLLYPVSRIGELASELGLPAQTLCTSERGRAIPFFRFGEGARSIVLTARHHACESSGSYVLEGVLRELYAAPIPGYEVFCVPAVDYDGAADGDQGKNRFPHDHNRDYLPEPLYPGVRGVKDYLTSHRVAYAFDFHSPWHYGGENDYVNIVRREKIPAAHYERFAALFESSLVPGAMPFWAKDFIPPDTGWNSGDSTRIAFGGFAQSLPAIELAFTLETPYFGTADAPASQESLVLLGRSFARALRRYIEEA